MLATLAAPHPDPGHAVDRTAPFLWYTVVIRAQSQIAICSRARDLGFETYCPMKREPVTVRKRGRTHTLAQVVSPLWPSYLFVALPSASPRFDLFQPVAETDRPDPLPPDARAGYVADYAQPIVEPIRGCLGFLGSSEGPMAVSEAVIQSIRLREQNGEFDSGRKSEASHRKWVKAVKWARRGLTIQFCGDDCPFAGRFGKITQVGDAAELIEIDMEIMGQIASISAPLDWIRSVRA